MFHLLAAMLYAASSTTIEVRDDVTEELVSSCAFSLRQGNPSEYSFWTTKKTEGDLVHLHRYSPKWISVNGGEFTLDEISSEVTIFVKSPGYEVVRMSTKELERSKRVLLRKVDPLRGRVVTCDAQPISNASVLIGELPGNYQEWNLENIRETVTDSEGYFELLHYPLSFPLLLTACSETGTAGYTIVSNKNLTSPPILICKPGEVNVKIAAAGELVKGASVSLRLLTEGGEQFGLVYGKTNESGGFVFTSLPACRLRLSIVSKEGTYDVDENLEWGQLLSIKADLLAKP